MIISETNMAINQDFLFIDTECFKYKTETENVYDNFCKNKKKLV